MKNLARQILSALSALLFLVLGVAIDALEFHNELRLFFVFGVLAALPGVCLLLQLLLSRSYARHFQGQSVEERHRFLLSHRSEAAKTVAEKLSLLRRIRALTRGYTVLLWLSAASAAFCGGLFGEHTVVITAMLLYAYFLFYSVYYRKRPASSISLDDAFVLDRKNTPQIHAVLDRAVTALGCRKPVVLLLSPQCNASIAQDKDKVCILIGVRLLYILS